MVRGKGVGFFSLPDSDQDILIPNDSLGHALDGDIVEIELTENTSEDRQTGRVLRVIESNHEKIVGVVIKSETPNGPLFLKPDNHRIHIKPILPNIDKDKVGMKVAVKITDWEAKPLSLPTAKIVEVIGKAGEHETEMQAIIKAGGFAENFPPEVSIMAQKLHEKRDQIFTNAKADTTGHSPTRLDFRDRVTFTIDPADAKDFDDALSVQNLPDGQVEIGIHIADVSYYVTPNDPIDNEARERGTSIYLVDRVIPMLPEILSNDLCSLKPKEDRLAFSAVFTLNNESKIVDEWYGQTIIHSDHRFSYEEAQKIIDNQKGDYFPQLDLLMKHSRKLRDKRYKSGAIAFEQPEVRFELDEKGKPIKAYTKERTETMMMIEDYMLLANQRVSKHIYKLAKSRGRDAAFIYRVHDAPDPDRIEELAIFIHALGYEFKTEKGTVSAKNINNLLEEITGKPEENLIKTATIRSMAKAVYSTKNIGHFGLAFKYYTHFTSPIRRYPDLMVHRLLRKHLDNYPISGKEVARYEKLAVQCSEKEVEAVRAERESIKYKQVEFMLDKVGQVFDGVITGVTDWGIYVQEKETQAEGMVRLSSMRQDFFTHHASKFHIKGQRTGNTFTLGDEVRVKLIKADLEARQLDFALL